MLPMATAQKVKTMIIQKEMKPGDRLPTETELAARFGVSRSTLREAMKFLRAENVVVIRQGSGTFVSAGTGIGEDPLGLHFTNQEKLLENPELVKEAWDNFHKNQPEPYVSPLPADLKPNLEG